MRADQSLLPPFISPRGTARWATGLLILSIVVAWLAVGIDLAQLRLLTTATAGSSVAIDAREAQIYTNHALLWTQSIVLAATGIAFVLWLYQARANLRALSVRRLVYPRHWVWAGFLVPALNVFRPYQVVREVWKASDPENLDPFAWRLVHVPRLPLLWWVSFVAWGSLELMALLSDVGAGLNLAKLQLSTGMLVLADTAAGVSACLACFVVARISDAQEAKYALQRAKEDEAVPASARASTQ